MSDGLVVRDWRPDPQMAGRPIFSKLQEGNHPPKTHSLNISSINAIGIAMPDLFDEWLLPSSQWEYMAITDTFSQQALRPFASSTPICRLSSANAAVPCNFKPAKHLTVGSFRAGQVLSFAPNIDSSFGHAQRL